MAPSAKSGEGRASDGLVVAIVTQGLKSLGPARTQTHTLGWKKWPVETINTDRSNQPSNVQINPVGVGQTLLKGRPTLPALDLGANFAEAADLISTA